jgi:hypothetical protein
MPHRKSKLVRKEKLSSEEQSARFIEAAKKAEADETGRKFEEAFDKIARSKPSSRHPHPSGKRSES